MSKRNYLFITAVAFAAAGVIFLTSANSWVGTAAGVLFIVNAVIAVVRGVIVGPDVKRGEIQ